MSHGQVERSVVDAFLHYCGNTQPGNRDPSDQRSRRWGGRIRFRESVGSRGRGVFSRERAVEFPLLIRLIDKTGRVTVAGQPQGEEACDEKKRLREAPEPR